MKHLKEYILENTEIIYEEDLLGLSGQGSGDSSEESKDDKSGDDSSSEEPKDDEKKDDSSVKKKSDEEKTIYEKYWYIIVLVCIIGFLGIVYILNKFVNSKYE